jgi:hypothetical protein
VPTALRAELLRGGEPFARQRAKGFLLMRVRNFALAWLAATLLSGIPSTLHALVTGRDPLEATRAAAAMLPLTPSLLVNAGIVHCAVSMFWAVILWLVLPRRHAAAWAVAAAALIGILDLRIIAPRFFPEVAALEFWPQMADHLAWGLCLGPVIQKRIGG